MSEKAMIQISDLYAMVNQFYREKRPFFHIKTPFLKEPLFSVGFKKEEILLRSPYSYHQYEQEMRHANRLRIDQEIPDYRMIKEMLIQSGILEYPNLNDLLLEIYDLCERDFMAGDRPAYLGLDTNLFRDRFYTTQYAWLRQLPDNKIGISISPYVKRELISNYKFSERRLSKLKDCCVQAHLKRYINEFFNQNQLEDRRRRLGHVEIDKARRLHWIILLPELDEDELQDNPDTNIILSYQLAVQERQVDILLLSRDSDFIAQAEGIPGIQTFLVENVQIEDLNLTVKDWYPLIQFIYILAIHYGIIELQSDGLRIVLLGIWRGKTGKEWRRETLILHLPEMDTPEMRLWRNIELLQEMKWEYY